MKLTNTPSINKMILTACVWMGVYSGSVEAKAKQAELAANKIMEKAKPNPDEGKAVNKDLESPAFDASTPKSDEMPSATPQKGSSAVQGNSAQGNRSKVLPKGTAPTKSIGSSKGLSKDDNLDEELVFDSPELKKPGSRNIPEGEDLVNIDFAELTDIKDIIKAVAMWTGKNVIMDPSVTGKVQIISPEKVTKEEAYQAFLSALNMLNLTTVETGKVLKIMKVPQAVKGNLKTYQGANWAPKTDEIITQIVPLKYIDAKQIQSTLSRVISPNAMIAYEPTNTLIISDSGFKVRRVLQILELLDVQTQQPKVLIIPVKYSDTKSIADKVNQILKANTTGQSSSSGYNSFKLLTDERTNSLIVFGPPKVVRDVKDMVEKFDVPVDDPTSTASIHVRPLDYADAKKLASTLSSLISGNKSSSPYGKKMSALGSINGAGGVASIAALGDGVKITADESSNALLITGSRSGYDALNTIIRKLDTRRSQVFVEADILDINEENQFKFGMSVFAGAGSADGAKSIIGWESGPMQPLVVASSMAKSAIPGAAVSTDALKGVASAFASDMTVGILSGQTVNIPGLGAFSPGALINMIKTDGNTRILASPHILTSNNEEASITVGEKLFFKSASYNAQTGSAIPKVENENVDLTLTIKPNISHSNYVTLAVTLDQNTVKGKNDDGLPVIAKRKSKQNVTVKSGQTIVISGLVNSSDFETYKKVPLLGDIPILGWLFRNSSLQSSKSNLVIFLTIYVVHGAQDLATIYQEKIKDRDNLMDRIYGSGYKDSDFYQMIPSMEDGTYKTSKQDQSEDQRMKDQREELDSAM